MIKIISDYEDRELIDLLSEVADRAYTLLLEFKGSDNLAVDVSFVDEGEIRGLNKRFRNVDKATDVLSFPLLDTTKKLTRKNNPYDFDDQLDCLMLGQVVLCLDVVRRQAVELGNTFAREAQYLFAHSLLHLIGYDHEDEAQKAQMRAKEKQIFNED